MTAPLDGVRVLEVASWLAAPSCAALMADMGASVIKVEPLEPGKINELRIPIVPTARLFQAGERIALRIKGADDEPATNSLQALARNHLRRPRPARISIHHDETHPSHLDLPITRGNLIGTFLSGGDISSFALSR